MKEAVTERQSIMKKYIWQDIIKHNLYCLKISGLWPESEQTYGLDLYTLYSVIAVNVFVTPHVLFQTINVIFVYSNMERLTETILVCVGEMLGVLKIYTFMRNIGMLKSLLKSLDADIFQPQHSRQVLLMQPAIHLWRMIYTILLGAAMATITLWLMIPILTGSTKNYGLPFMAWYPYNYKKSLLYELTYLHQTFSTVVLGLGDYNIDMLMSALMMYIGAQCDILCDNLRSLGTDSKEFRKALIQCVEHHKEILRFGENCNIFLNFMMLAQFFTSSVCVALGLFQLVLVTPTNVEFYTLFCCIMSLIMQIFTYCWFGDEVESKSSKISYSAFESLWFKESNATKKSLLIFAERAQFPIKLSTFKLFYLSLDTFVRILRSAVSYYTILRQLTAPK